MENIFTNYFASASVILFGIGFSTLLLNNNLIKKIIGINVMDTSVFMFFISIGYIKGRYAPIITESIKNANQFVNPVPTALMLTGIVVAVSTTALALALTLKLYEKYGTVELDEILKMREE